MLFENIKPDILFELERNHMNLSHLYEIEKSYISDTIRGIPEALLNFLSRKDYLSKEGLITEKGRKFYELISNPTFSTSTIDIKKELKKIKSEYDRNFLEWWEEYPSSDINQSINAPATRSFKTLKDECQVDYLKILNSNQQTHKDMVEALRFMVYAKKKASRPGDNKLTFIQNTKTYLHQGSYNGWISIMKSDQNWQKVKGTTQEQTKEQSDIMIL